MIRKALRERTNAKETEPRDTRKREVKLQFYTTRFETINPIVDGFSFRQKSKDISKKGNTYYKCINAKCNVSMVVAADGITGSQKGTHRHKDMKRRTLKLGIDRPIIFPQDDDAFAEHERNCAASENRDNVDQQVVDNIVNSDDEEQEAINGQQDFMAYFALSNANSEVLPRKVNSHYERFPSPKKKISLRAKRDLKRKERELERTIPFSSPAGLVLTQKSRVGEDQMAESIEETEEFCVAKPRMKIPHRPKHRHYPGPQTDVVKKMNQTYRHYYWPKKTRHSITKEVNFDFLNRPIIERLKDCSVVMKQLTSGQIRGEMERLRQLREAKERESAAECVNLCSDSENDSIDIDEGLVSRSFEHTHNGKFSMSYQRSVSGTVFMPALLPYPSSSPLLTSNNFFLAQQTNSYETTTSSTIYQISTSTPTNMPGPSRLSCENIEAKPQQRSIQQWLQNVSGGENFGINCPATAINGN